jgi:hypothetical protein
MEQLDHRRLLAVNFTGNAILDIPGTNQPGTAVVENPTRVPIRDPALNALIQVSGFDIEAIRMEYTPDDDVLSVALQQPINPKAPEFRVIAGDADNNGDGGTVEPAVKLVQPLFMDFPNLGGSETFGIFLDLNDDGIPDVVAGVPNTPGAGKLFTVNDALVSSDPDQAATTAPGFGAPLPGNTGFAFLRDTDPAHGAFEFQITHFSELYKAKTGADLAVDSKIGVGGFGGSNDDFIDEEFVPAQTVSFGVVPPPPPVCPPPPECPPQSPMVLINPHEHRHINTAHPTLVRVNLFGSSGFEVNNIFPETVRFGGAAPIAHFVKNLNNDEFPDATYVFWGNQLQLPTGESLAHVTGQYLDAATGQVASFDTAKIVFNKDFTRYGPGQIAQQEHRQAIRGAHPAGSLAFMKRRARQEGVDLVLDQIQAENAQAWNPQGRPTVAIPTARARAARYTSSAAARVAAAPAPQSPALRAAIRAAEAPAPAASSAAMAASPAALRAQQKVSQSDYFDQLSSSLAM